MPPCGDLAPTPYRERSPFETRGVPGTGRCWAVRSWLARPQVLIVQPGPRHLDLLAELMRAGSASGTHTTDVHLAALAIEHQAELSSNDSDLVRFPGLRWTDPLR